MPIRVTTKQNDYLYEAGRRQLARERERARLAAENARSGRGSLLQALLGGAGDFLYGRPGYPKNIAQRGASNIVTGGYTHSPETGWIKERR